MRVAFLTTSYPSSPEDPRGSHVHLMASSLVSKGVDVTAYAPLSRPTPFELDGVRAVPMDLPWPWTPALASGISGIVPNLRARPWLATSIIGLVAGMRATARRILRDFDLIHAHWLVPSGWAAVSVRSEDSAVPVVITAHGGDVNLLKKARAGRLAASVARRADKVTAVSEAGLEFLRSLAVENDPVLLPLGVRGRKVERSLPTGSFRLLYVGGLNRRKSVETLIHAVKRLPPSCDVELVIAGDGPTASNLHEIARTSSGGTRIAFLGPVSPGSVPELMASADALVLPSKSEGRPVVVMEAMSASLPVVATDIPGTNELVGHGETGLLFPVGDVDALSACLVKLISDRALALDLGQRGRQRLDSLGLTDRQMADRLLSIYESVLG